MTEDQNDRLDIKDPSASAPSPAEEIAVDDEGDFEADVDGQVDEKKATPRPKAEDAGEPEDLSDFLDEVAGKRIIDLQKEIANLKKLVEQRESDGRKTVKAETAPAPAQDGDKVAKRQSQFVSRTSSREGTSLTPVERATRSVEELMRKRGLL